MRKIRKTAGKAVQAKGDYACYIGYQHESGQVVTAPQEINYMYYIINYIIYICTSYKPGEIHIYISEHVKV